MPDLFRHPTRIKIDGMRDREPCVYVLASGRLGTLYVGVTSNLIGRMIQHREGAFDGFSKRFGFRRLVWFDVADTMEAAIAYEKKLKKWPRDWKCNLDRTAESDVERSSGEFGVGAARLSDHGLLDPGTSPG